MDSGHDLLIIFKFIYYHNSFVAYVLSGRFLQTEKQASHYYSLQAGNGGDSMKHSAVVVTMSIVLTALLFMECLSPPSDPDDPMNVEVSLFFTDSDNEVTAGNEKEIGIEVSYPEYIDHYNLRSSCGDVDTEFTFLSEALRDTFHLSPLFLNEGRCTLSVVATLQDSRINGKTDSISIRVLAGDPFLFFSTIPMAFTTHTGRTDTLRFGVTSSKNANVNYTLSCDVELDSNEMHLADATDDDSAFIYFNPEQPGIYTVTLIASADDLSDTVPVLVTVLASIRPTESDNPRTITTGTTDTLIYTLTPE